jgi:hypothetical protein
MTCPKCKAVLTHRNRDGNAMIRTKGLVMKADGPVAICPKCTADVKINMDLLKVLPTLLFRTR